MDNLVPVHKVGVCHVTRGGRMWYALKSWSFHCCIIHAATTDCWEARWNGLILKWDLLEPNSLTFLCCSDTKMPVDATSYCTAARVCTKHASDRHWTNREKKYTLWVQLCFLVLSTMHELGYILVWAFYALRREEICVHTLTQKCVEFDWVCMPGG